MTLHIYRYRRTAPFSDLQLRSLTGPSATFVGQAAGILTDIQIDDSLLADLDDIMASAGYVRIATDPVPSVETAFGDSVDHGTLAGLGDNDHTQYQLTSQKGAASGYAGLDASANITDATHGNRAGGTLHAIATTSVAGFISASDKTKLDGIAASAAALTSSAPVDVTKAAAAVGVATDAARADHKHDVSTAAGTIGIGGGNSEGVATSLARSDHNHALRTTTGPTDLTIAGINDRDFLKRYGTTVTGFPLPIKTSCVVVSTTDITLSAPQTIDGVGVVAGDRVLVTGQTTAANNGIYVVAAGAWTRATDMDASADLIASLIVPVSQGTANLDTVWMLSSNGPFTLGTTALNWKLLTRPPNEIVKEAWFPITSNAVTAKGDFATVSVGANASIQFTVRFPSDLTTIIQLVCVGIPNGTFTNQDIDITSDYALAGQIFNTNQGSDTTTLYSGTINTMFELNIATIFPGAIANHYGGCTIKHNAIGTTIGYIGIWLKYA